MSFQPRDYDFVFTAKEINYCLALRSTEEFELQIIKQNPITQDWDQIVVGWGTTTLYDLETGKYTTEEMVGHMCRIFNERILGKSDNEQPIPDGLPDVIKQLMLIIKDKVKFTDENGLELIN